MALPYTDCQSQLLLNAAAPYTLRGSTTATVWVPATTPTLLSQPYVRRTYDIAPATNDATATADVVGAAGCDWATAASEAAGVCVVRAGSKNLRLTVE